MLANILIVGFIGAFCVIALLGHILLLLAVWPGLLPKPHAREYDSAGMDHTRPAPLTSQRQKLAA